MAFSEACRQGFSPGTLFPPLLHQFNGSANEIKPGKCDINSVKHNSLNFLFIPCGM